MTDTPDGLSFLPLGGTGEIGMNFALYGFGPAQKREWMIDQVGIRSTVVSPSP